MTKPKNHAYHSRRRTEYETRYLLLKYLSDLDRHDNGILVERKAISFTHAAMVMFKTHRDTHKILNMMKEEGLIEINRLPHSKWMKGTVRITAKGLEIGQMLEELNSMIKMKGVHL